MTPEHQQAEREALKPCPFCGAPASEIREIVLGNVWSVDCSAHMLSHTCSAMSWQSAEHCAEQWNRRAGERADVVPQLTYQGPWCCEKGQAAGKPLCDECADASAAYSAAMAPELESLETGEADAVEPGKG